MMEGDVEVLYEDDEIIVLRISWVIFGEHAQKIVTRHKDEEEA